MSGQVTVLAAAGATVPASGVSTAIGLLQVARILASAQAVPGSSNVIVLNPDDPTLPAAAAVGPTVLIVPNSVGEGSPLSLAIPAGYAAVILGRGSHVNITTTDPATEVVSAGAIDFSGVASFVDGTGGTGVVSDSALNAVIDIGGGAYSVTAGSADTVNFGNGTAVISAGVGDAVVLGDGTQSARYYQLYPGATSVSGATLTAAGADAITVNSLGNLIVDNMGTGADTISALFGSSTVFAGAGDVYQGAGHPAATEFIGSAQSGAAQTVFGGLANDTVFGGAGRMLYSQGTGAYSLFVGGAGSATVLGGAAGAGAVFGGSGSTLYDIGGSSDVFVGAHGSDTVVGGAAQASVFAGGNERVALVNSHAADALPAGDNDTIDASLALGGTNFFAMSAIGDATLIGTAAAGVGDTFQFVRTAEAAAHTVSVENWHPGDGLFLSGYGPADIAALDDVFTHGGTSITLSDGTTINFDGAAPTHALGPVAW